MSTIRSCASIRIANGACQPTHDRTHFEFLVLEAAQAGLSWSIVLKKRDGYRRAFSQFDPGKVARYSAARIDKLTAQQAIIRNRLKIAAAVKNARSHAGLSEVSVADIEAARPALTT
jgi:DNA-3-methyladenine glycosylase I